MPENEASANVLRKNGFKRVLRGAWEDWGYDKPTVTDKWVITGMSYRYQYRFQT